MFVDRADIFVKGGDGGHGCLSFHRAKYIPHGGPDGGNGGDGGHVWLEACDDIDTLLDMAGRHHWIAESGRNGQGSNRQGRSGEDLVVRVPPGTMVYDRDTGILLKDLDRIGTKVLVARGGRGGRGNKVFATPTHQTPREFEPGEPGQFRNLRLELRLIADVGIVGLPNAGKSTLLSRLTRATPRIADYPFTTLAPQLGIVELSGFRRLVVADIPGLIEGAHEGVGLGDDFLRHIERTRIIVHLIDMAGDVTENIPAQAYGVIRNELVKYSSALAAKPELVVANKMDITGSQEWLEWFREELGCEVLAVSAATGEGIEPLKERLWRLTQSAREQDGSDATPGSNPDVGVQAF